MVELIAVIVIVGASLGLWLPAMSRAKGQAKRIVCLSHLRSWGLATAYYVEDNNGLLPRDGAPNGSSRRFGWYVELPELVDAPAYHQAPWRTNALAPLGRTIWHCPSNPSRSNGHNLFHYTLNGRVNGSGVGAQIQLAKIPKPTRTVWLFDNGGLAAVAQHNNVAPNRHGHAANFLFLDGRAQSYNAEAFWNHDLGRGRLDNPEMLWSPIETP